MGWHEAIEDGITIGKDGRDSNCYYPPCHICDTPVYSWTYTRGTKYTCKDCRAELVRQAREEGEVISTDKKQMKLQNAIKRISKITGIEHYKDAIRLVEESLSRTGWYQSTEEIMVALELIRRNVKAFHQVKIFDYSVDFILPEMKVALEIDGKIYHGKDRQKYESIRDEVIINKLGEGWEMIRITTDNINKNVPKLIPGINAVLKSRKLKRG